MKRRLWVSGILLLALAMAFVSGAQAATWKLSHVRPQDTAIDKELNWFANAAKEASGGKIQMKTYPANALGDYTLVQERIGMGSIDMACQPPTSNADKRFQLVYFPYLVASWDQAKKNYSKGAPLRVTTEELYAKQNIRVLAAWPVYFGGIALNKEAKSPGDPSVAKGLKVRVPPMKAFQLLADSTGYIGTPLPFSEAFTAVQTGVVDGVIGSGAEGYYSSFRDVTKFYIPINTHFEVWYLIMNEDLYKKLDATQKKALEDVAAKFEQRRWEAGPADQTANEKKLVDAGAKLVAVSPQEIAATAKKAQGAVWPKILEDVGKEWGEKVLKAIAQ
jgi:TRAP-type C4-dicarboxylate transport system substrate-binding protein